MVLTVRQTDNESIMLGDLNKLFGGITAIYMEVDKQKMIQVIKNVSELMQCDLCECVYAWSSTMLL